ncbi:hypothetical protein HZC34_01865 [Candidatus Saganbacteria bacterium]|nr:hypothetical protein [Candidatus Saganbacteria bacterium]
MSYVPNSVVKSYINAGGRSDIKSIAHDIYEVQFPKLLADWLDPDKAIDTGKIKLSAAQKVGVQGQYVFSQLSQQYADIFQGAFSIFNLQLNDVKSAEKWLG